MKFPSSWAAFGAMSAMYRQLAQKESPKPGRMEQSSCYGRALPIVYGKTRITGNIIYHEGTEFFGGQSGFGAQLTQVALCEGPITSVARAWLNGQILFGGRALPLGLTVAVGSISILTGTRPTQTAWSQLPAGKDLGYPGVALACSLYKIDGATTIGDYSWEVAGFLTGTDADVLGDADPAQIIPDLFGDDNYYSAGFTKTINVSTGRDGLAASSYDRYVMAAGLWISLACVEQKPAKEHLQECLDATNSTCLWTGGTLEIVPLCDEAVTGNSVTFTPCTTVRYNLTAADLIREGDADAVYVDRTPAESDNYNCFPIGFLERAPTGATADPGLAYNKTVVEDPEPYDSQINGVRRAPVTQMDSICVRDVALKISRIMAQRSVWQKNSYRFRLGWRFALLQPCDLVTIPVCGTTRTVQIQTITESDDHSYFDVEADDFLAGVSNAIAHTTTSSDGSGVTVATLRDQLHEKAATTWSETIIPARNWNQAAWFEPAKMFVATTTDGAYIVWAKHGADWTVASTLGTGAAYGAIATDGTTIVVGGAGGVAYSTDGDTWTDATTDPSTTTERIVSTDTGDFTTGWSYSTNSGSTWTDATDFPAAWETVAGLVYNGSRLVAIGDEVTGDYVGVWKVSYSDDAGDNWSDAATLPGTGDNGYYGLAYGNGVFVAVGYDHVATSFDGVTWTENPSIPDGDWSTISFTGRIFVIMSGASSNYTPLGAKIRTSADGVSWTPEQSIGWPATWWNMAWGPPGGVVVGTYRAAASTPICTY